MILFHHHKDPWVLFHPRTFQSFPPFKVLPLDSCGRYSECRYSDQTSPEVSIRGPLTMCGQFSVSQLRTGFPHLHLVFRDIPWYQTFGNDKTITIRRFYLNPNIFKTEADDLWYEISKLIKIHRNAFLQNQFWYTWSTFLLCNINRDKHSTLSSAVLQSQKCPVFMQVLPGVWTVGTWAWS
jgi:hypothetical protein